MNQSDPPLVTPDGSRVQASGEPVALPADRTQMDQPVTKPYVTYTLIGVTILVFVLQQLELFFGISVPFLLDVKNNELIVSGEYWRLVTPMFLHAGILHLAFNMYALSILGPGLERYFGHRRFALLYLLSGIAGNVLSFLLTPSRSLGASTAVFGLLGAQGVFLYLNRRLFARIARQAINQTIMIAVVNLVIGELTPGIDNWGHLGGLAGGIAFTWFAGPVFTVEQSWEGISVADSRTRSRVFFAVIFIGALLAILAAAGIAGRGS